VRGRSVDRESPRIKDNAEAQRSRRFAEKAGDIPHPGYFAKRGWKLLKTKNGSSKKRAKSVKEAVSL